MMPLELSLSDAASLTVINYAPTVINYAPGVVNFAPREHL
jgi:hypothetical protein